MSKLITADIIKVCAYITKYNGYVKRTESKQNCTVEKVLDALETNSISDDELEEVKDRVSEWFNYIGDESKQTGDYFNDVRSVVTNPSVNDSKIGLIASSFASFDRYRLFKAKSAVEQNSEYLGEEGDSIDFNIAEYKLIKSGTSKYKNGSSWYMYKIKDEHGNIIMWFADHDCTQEFLNHKQASAVITKLNTFNEVKQTNVSRLKFK